MLNKVFRYLYLCFETVFGLSVIPSFCDSMKFSRTLRLTMLKFGTYRAVVSCKGEIGLLIRIYPIIPFFSSNLVMFFLPNIN